MMKGGGGYRISPDASDHRTLFSGRLFQEEIRMRESTHDARRRVVSCVGVSVLSMSLIAIACVVVGSSHGPTPTTLRAPHPPPAPPPPLPSTTPPPSPPSPLSPPTAYAWVEVGDIDGERANDLSGFSVAMSSDGSRVAIGAVYNDGNGTSYSGHVRVYTENGGRWEQVGLDIDGERANDYSGFPVAMSSDGSRVAIGAIYNDGNGANSGHVRVYHHNEGMAWETIGSDIRGESAGDNSGRSVAMSSDGSRVAIGAPYNDGNGTSDSGHVRVYDLLTAPPPSPPPPSRPPAFPGGRYVEGTVHCEGGVWPSELSWTMECESPEGDPRLSLQGGAPYNKTWTILPPANCTLSMFDSFGDGWGEGEWSGFGNGPYKVPADNATWSETFTVWPPT